MVDKLGLNASYSTNSQSSQNSSDVSQNDLKKTVIYEHSVFGIKDTDGKVGVEDLQILNGAHRVKNDAAYDLRAEICDFLANNEGKSWTKDLKDKIDKLINDFNKANKSEARRELIEDDQGNLLERNTYDKLGKLTIAQKRTYYENGQVRIVESDGDGNILLDELYTKDSVFIKNNMEK